MGFLMVVLIVVHICRTVGFVGDIFCWFLILFAFLDCFFCIRLFFLFITCPVVNSIFSFVYMNFGSVCIVYVGWLLFAQV